MIKDSIAFKTFKNDTSISRSIEIMNPPVELKKRHFIWSRLSDFWLLGGLSILVCFILHVVASFRSNLPVLEMRFSQLMPLFSILSIFCNHPHFIISYRIGYGRGWKFILKNWFALIFVPLAMLFFYGIAYFYYDAKIADSVWLLKVNEFFSATGLSFRIGHSSQLGAEIIGISVWIMYFTVGWHYCKQVFGCMMVYSFYDGYRLANWQKSIIKWTVTSVAFYQFVYLTRAMEHYSSEGAQDIRFQGFSLSSLGLPEWMSTVSIVLMICLSLCSLGVFLLNFKKTRQLPSINFLTPLIAFYVWWVPFRHLPEFYLWMVPFFHSLQYLPFAFRLEGQKIAKNRWYNTQISIRLFILLLVGFAAFELIPSLLDASLATDHFQSVWFFTTAFAVFINIHHFFIDSVAWKFENKEVKESLLF